MLSENYIRKNEVTTIDNYIQIGFRQEDHVFYDISEQKREFNIAAKDYGGGMNVYF